jgi:hypothetical protein
MVPAAQLKPPTGRRDRRNGQRTPAVSIGVSDIVLPAALPSEALVEVVTVTLPSASVAIWSTYCVIPGPRFAATPVVAAATVRPCRFVDLGNCRTTLAGRQNRFRNARRIV